MFALPKAIFLARREMKAEPPAVVVGFGGYASVPGSVAGLCVRAPLIIQEQNVIPGLANRLLASRADAIAVAFEATLEKFPRWRKKAAVTGNPLFDYDYGDGGEDAWSYFEIERGRLTVAVLGGSQGAASINRAVLELLPLLRDRDDLQIVHSVGPDKYQELEAEAAKVDKGKLVYRPLEFIKRMDLLYECADVAVSRAGASTISELAAAGCPAILVPYPYATAGHQEANAAVLTEAGGALLVRDDDLNGITLASLLQELLAQEGRLQNMGEAAGRLGKPDATARLAEMVLAVRREK
jgi:UDP-N-acetylglucosamine--N-acetylmuramyl-(pentapeptide) pyrophosphoryl-undecaprenol N-acetylglucosamine transferase